MSGPVVECREAAYRGHQISKVFFVIDGLDTFRKDHAELLDHRVERIMEKI